MYTSTLFRWALRHARATCDVVFVLSAKHGLLPVDRVIEPYDEELPRGAAARRAWGERVAAELDAAVPDLDAQIVVFAGEAYADAIVPADRDFLWEEPLRGMQVGERLAWLKAAHEERERDPLDALDQDVDGPLLERAFAADISSSALDFAYSLREQYERRGSLSPRQRAALERILREAGTRREVGALLPGYDDEDLSNWGEDGDH